MPRSGGFRLAPEWVIHDCSGAETALARIAVQCKEFLYGKPATVRNSIIFLAI